MCCFPTMDRPIPAKNSFMKLNGIRHIRTMPDHPSPNGLEERAIQMLKTVSLDTTVQIPLQLQDDSPCNYQNSPATLLLDRQLHTRLSLIFPNLGEGWKGSKRHSVEPRTTPAGRDYKAWMTQRKDWFPSGLDSINSFSNRSTLLKVITSLPLLVR